MPYMDFDSKKIIRDPKCRIDGVREFRLTDDDERAAAELFPEIDKAIKLRRRTAQRRRTPDFSCHLGTLGDENKPCPPVRDAERDKFKKPTRTVTEGTLFLVREHYKELFPDAKAVIDDGQDATTRGVNDIDSKRTDGYRPANPHGAVLLLVGLYVTRAHGAAPVEAPAPVVEV